MPSVPVKLIINADDFGLSKGICRGIIDAHEAGVVTSTSLMANIAGHNESEMLCHVPNLGVGIHLNLTRGPAVSTGDLGLLVDAGRNFVYEHRQGFDDVDEEHIRRELHAQVEKALDTGLPNIDHLDSHHHIHRHRFVFDTMKDLAVEKGLACRASDPWMADELRDAGVWRNDFFVENFFGLGNITVENLINIMNSLKNGVTELMCHPGYADETLKLPSGYVQERPLELKTLTNPMILSAIKSKGVELIRFGE